jgi:hypothetical protein
VSKYPDDVEVPWFQGRIKCGKCGCRGRWVDVRPNWKENPGMPDSWEGPGGVMAAALDENAGIPAGR